MGADHDVEALKRGKPDLRIIPDAALNAETPVSRLDAAITPIEAFFVRNNGDVPPPVDVAAWRLTIDGCVVAPRAFGLDELRRSFETVTVTAVLECAGNNRAAFDPPTDGLRWGRGAVGCARWTGVRLRDVLGVCGVRPEARYTGHHAPDRSLAGDKPAISRGLPIETALAPETILAWAMNDAELTRLHGAPLRIVAPGAPGSAWQKWLSRIELRDRVHDGEKMNGTDYRLPRRPLRPGDPIDPAAFEVIERMPVNAMITRPADGERVTPGAPIEVAGYAWSGEAPLASVAVSTDEGRTWREARLAPEVERYVWRRFSAHVVCGPGETLTILARATDAAGRAQPVDQAPWNPRGYCNNASHRISVRG